MADEEPEERTKLFIGGVNWSTNEEMFKDFFSQFGPVVESIIMRERDGKSRGFGFVVFFKRSSAEKVMASQLELDGRPLDCKFAVPKGETPGFAGRQGGANVGRICKIFVGGIHLDASQEDLRSYFSSYGVVAETTIMQDHMSQKSRGFGFVTFDSANAVDAVIQDNDKHILMDKKMDCKVATPRPERFPGGRGGWRGDDWRSSPGGWNGPPQGGWNGPPQGGWNGPPQGGWNGPPQGGWNGPPRGGWNGPPQGGWNGPPHGGNGNRGGDGGHGYQGGYSGYQGGRGGGGYSGPAYRGGYSGGAQDDGYRGGGPGGYSNYPPAQAPQAQTPQAPAAEGYYDQSGYQAGVQSQYPAATSSWDATATPVSTGAVGYAAGASSSYNAYPAADATYSQGSYPPVAQGGGNYDPYRAPPSAPEQRFQPYSSRR